MIDYYIVKLGSNFVHEYINKIGMTWRKHFNTTISAHENFQTAARTLLNFLDVSTAFTTLMCYWSHDYWALYMGYSEYTTIAKHVLMTLINLRQIKNFNSSFKIKNNFHSALSS